MPQTNILLPCWTFFSAGENKLGLLNLGLQATVVFWPAAYRWARSFRDSQNVENMLGELAKTYQAPAREPPPKRFR